MSQVSIIDIEGNNPQIPTQFNADIGFAIPLANVLNVLGSTDVPGTTPVFTVGSGNTITTKVQISQAIAASNATNIGLSAFNSAHFSVDANGFVSITAGTGVLQTLTGNTGGAIAPVLGNINTIGTGSITIAGAGNTLTTQLTGLTNHAVLVGAGTATITKVGPTAIAGQVLQSAGSLADPVFSTATYPSTTTINQLLYSSAANVVGGVTGVTRAVLTTTSTGVPIWRAVTDGQLIIGSSSSQPIAANITPGTGISIVNGANSITINATGGGQTWLDASGTFTAAANTGYFLTAASTPTLPLAPAQGTVCEFAVVATATMTITAGVGEFIRLDGAVSAAAGTAVAGTIGNTIELVYRTVGTTWWATSSVGASWTIT